MVARQWGGSGDPAPERKSEMGCEQFLPGLGIPWRALPVDGVSRDTQAVQA